MAMKIRMKDAAYFVIHDEILSWINSTLNLSLSKVEEVMSRVVQCQPMDAVHPGIIPKHKVNFDANSHHEMIQNYKVLHHVFKRLKITKNLELGIYVTPRPKEHGYGAPVELTIDGIEVPVMYLETAGFEGVWKSNVYDDG